MNILNSLLQNTVRNIQAVKETIVTEKQISAEEVLSNRTLREEVQVNLNLQDKVFENLRNSSEFTETLRTEFRVVVSAAARIGGTIDLQEAMLPHVRKAVQKAAAKEAFKAAIGSEFNFLLVEETAQTILMEKLREITEKEV
jgi:DNA-binding transcriptional regulator YhcF (GntR family)